jgi:putative phosphoribosyl transferase
VTDDGLATGATMQAAIWSVQQEQAERVIVAVPGGSQQAARKLAAIADEVIMLWAPADFYAVGQLYVHFDQVSDTEVMAILREEARRRGEPGSPR